MPKVVKQGPMPDRSETRAGSSGRERLDRRLDECRSRVDSLHIELGRATPGIRGSSGSRADRVTGHGGNHGWSTADPPRGVEAALDSVGEGAHALLHGLEQHRNSFVPTVRQLTGNHREPSPARPSDQPTGNPDG